MKTPALKPRRRLLSDDDVRAIRADDRPPHEVAWAYRVSEATVWGVKARRRKGYVSDAPLAVPR